MCITSCLQRFLFKEILFMTQIVFWLKIAEYSWFVIIAFFTDTSRMELLYAFLLSCIICSLLVLSITALNYFKIVPSSVSRKLTHICKLFLFLITLIVMGAVFTLCWILFPDQTQSKYVAASRTSFRLERIGSSSNIVLHCSALPVLAPLRPRWLRPHQQSIDRENSVQKWKQKGAPAGPSALRPDHHVRDNQVLEAVRSSMVPVDLASIDLP